MVFRPNYNETIELDTDINQGTLSRYSIKYILPIFFMSSFSDENPQFIESKGDVMSGQLNEVYGSHIDQLKTDFLGDPVESLIFDIHEMSQTSSNIEAGDSKVYLEQFITLENFAKDLLENSTTLPGEINKLMYDNIDDLLI